jgi:hypothetical protein
VVILGISMVTTSKSSPAHRRILPTKPAPFIPLIRLCEGTSSKSTQEVTSSCDSRLIIQICLQSSLSFLKLTFSARIQLFHCHIEWHVEAGLTATFIEAPDVLQDTQTIPHGHYKTCESQGIPTKGNAAGNTKNWLDLTGANTAWETSPWG